MTPEERFAHLEDVMARIAAAHLELGNAQINSQKAFTRYVDESNARGKVLDEKIANLAILVDRLIERDLQ